MHRSRILLAIAFAATIGGVSAQNGYEWVQRASLPAAARYGTFNFVIGDYGYVAGGGNNGSVFSDCWRYSPASDTWQQMASMPMALRHGAAFAINGKGYVSCGQNSTSTFSNALYCYDPTTNSWSTKASLPAYARYGPHAYSIGEFGYLGGGNRGSAQGPYLSDQWQYDPVLDSWSASNGIPGLPRYGATAFVIDGKGYVQGGRDQSLAFTTQLWEFDPTGLSWTLKPPMPGVGRSWSMVMAFPYEAVIVGGKDIGQVIYHDGFQYYPYTNNWIVIPDYPGGSGWSGTSFGIGSRTFGGLGKELVPSDLYFNDFWELVKGENISVEEIAGSTAKGILRVVPNPVASGESIQIVLGSQFTGTGRVSVSDAMGRTVFQGTMSSTITVPSLPSGSYQVYFHRPSGDIFHGRFMVL